MSTARTEQVLALLAWSCGPAVSSEACILLALSHTACAFGSTILAAMQKGAKAGLRCIRRHNGGAVRTMIAFAFVLRKDGERTKS